MITGWSGGRFVRGGTFRFAALLSILASPLLWASYAAPARNLGLFEGNGDVGRPARAGSVRYTADGGSYTVRGGGENMWFGSDSFHFVWKKVSGDFALKSAVAWAGKGGNAHRKACLIVRQSLSPDSPYVDVALHGDGLTSLQFRDSTGGATHEVQANAAAPPEIGIERQGDSFIMLLRAPGGKFEPSGAFTRVKFTDPVYVGLAVCAHDDRALETARFSSVELGPVGRGADTKPALHSSLEIVSLSSGDRRVAHHAAKHFEAPNWSRDGGTLIFNSGGLLYRLPVAGGEPAQIDTGTSTRCNNDHGLSPDGTRLAISDSSKGGQSRIYVLPATGGMPNLITELAPSFWHGWSPDGTTLAYCGARDGEYDIYTIPAAGGTERRLTTAPGLDDGPDYSPDGRYIYFNSVRTGLMQVWRMAPDGSGQEQITKDDFNNWFPHPSPDGKWIVFVSYEKDVTGHPANKPVSLRIMPAAGGPVRELVRLFGGQGTINVPSWSPDSQKIAFVSYEFIAP
jgi:TolB protein